MIFDVAGTLLDLGHLALELLEQLAGRLAHDVDQNIEPATMGHADGEFLDALRAASLHQFVQGWNQAFRPFQGETLLSHVFVVQIALQTLGGREAAQQAFLDLVIGAPLVILFHPLLYPLPLGGIGNVQVLCTDMVTIDKTQNPDDLAQRLFTGPGLEIE